MIESRESFSIDLWVPNNDPSQLRKELSDWIKTRSNFLKIDVIDDLENYIQIEYEVHSISGFVYFRWTLKAMATFNLTFTIKENLFKIDAQINITRQYNSFQALFWRIKCRDFLRTFFTQIELGENPLLLTTLYPKEELENFLKGNNFELRKGWFIVSIFFTLLMLLSRQFEHIITVNIFLLFVMIFFGEIDRIDKRSYIKYLNLH